MDSVLKVLSCSPPNFTFISKDKCALIRAKNPFISKSILTLREAIIYLSTIVTIGSARNYQILDPIKRCILEGKSVYL